MNFKKLNEEIEKYLNRDKAKEQFLDLVNSKQFNTMDVTRLGIWCPVLYNWSKEEIKELLDDLGFCYVDDFELIVSLNPDLTEQDIKREIEMDKKNW